MGLCRAFYVGRLSCSDCGESAPSGGAEGKEALPGQIMVFRWPDCFLPHGSEAMVSQGRPREDPHDLHVRGEGLRSKGRSIGRGSLCGSGQAHLPTCFLGAQLRSGHPDSFDKAFGFISASGSTLVCAASTVL